MKRLVLLWFVSLAVASAAVPALTSLTATPRYPWNGLVDVEFTISDGDPGSGCADPESGDERIAGRRLRYVQCTCEAQLNTGVMLGSRDVIEMKFEWEGHPSFTNKCLFCARGNTSTSATYTALLVDGRWRFDYNATEGTEADDPVPVPGTPTVIRVSAGTAFVDGTLVQSHLAADFTVGGPLTLFASYTEAPGTNTDNCLRGKIYYLKIFGNDGTTLLHDFVPWMRDGEVGLLDLVDLRFAVPRFGDLTAGTREMVAFSAKNAAGGTNLTMKTLRKENGTLANPAKEQLFPGKYRWVWDAPADLSARWGTFPDCVPTNGAVLFSNMRLSEIDSFYAVPCGKSIKGKTHRVKGGLTKADGVGKSVQFAFSDDLYTKCVCVHFEQSGADVVGYVKWGRYVSGRDREQYDFDTNSATDVNVAVSENDAGYGLYLLEARTPHPTSSLVLDRVVVESSLDPGFPYTVKFNPNLGIGTMEDETFTYGRPQALPANAFIRPGYVFDGWSTASGWPTFYADKQIVTNLTSILGKTVSLYAKWKPLTAATANYLVIDLSGGPSATKYPVTYLDALPSGGFNVDAYKTTKLVLRKIPAGTDPHGRYSITQPFYVGVFEVTQKQYELVMGENPSYYQGDKRAVESVSYNTIRGESAGAGWPASSAVDSTSFLGKLRARAVLTSLDLPTEAQWEYACRAETTSDYNNGGSTEADLKTLGRYSANQNDGRGGYTGNGTTTVGSYAPNAWGLYDMHGNASEWCRDWYYYYSTLSGPDPQGPGKTSDRVIRGGSWIEVAGGARSSQRNFAPPSAGHYYYGFRLVCSTGL